MQLRQSDGTVSTLTLRAGNYTSTDIVNKFGTQLIVLMNGLGYLDNVINSRTNTTLNTTSVMVLNVSLSEAEYNRVLASPFELYNIFEDDDSHIIMGGKKRTQTEMNTGADGSLKVEISQTSSGGYLLQISGYYQMRTASEMYLYLCSDDVSYNMSVASNNRLSHSNIIAKIPVDDVFLFDAYHKSEYSVPYHSARDSVMQSLHLKLVTSRGLPFPRIDASDSFFSGCIQIHHIEELNENNTMEDRGSSMNLVYAHNNMDGRLRNVR
eukprot:4140244-Pleurochrysis_carterae.AAC.5